MTNRLAEIRAIRQATKAVTRAMQAEARLVKAEEALRDIASGEWATTAASHGYDVRQFARAALGEADRADRVWLTRDEATRLAEDLRTFSIPFGQCLTWAGLLDERIGDK